MACVSILENLNIKTPLFVGYLLLLTTYAFFPTKKNFPRLANMYEEFE